MNWNVAWPDSLRVRALVRKETLQALRDPSTIAIALILPMVLLLLFGYGISLDAEHVPIGFVIERPSVETADFEASFSQSVYLQPIRYATFQAAEAGLARGDISAIIRLRGSFSEDLYAKPPAAIGVTVNGTDANNARIVQGYIQGALGKWLAARAAGPAVQAQPPVTLEQRIWFNPELNSRYFIVPGLVAVIMTLTGALLTAMVIAREWERGTMEALMVTPVTTTEILLGKLIPYFILGIGSMLLSVGVGVVLFNAPLRGSLLLLLLTSMLFLLVMLGMGLLCSTVTKNQFLAGQIAIVGTYLPAFILSGFIFDTRSMPQIIEVITGVVSARYYVSILQTLFLAGNVWTVILSNSLVLFIMALFFLTLVCRKTTKLLE